MLPSAMLPVGLVELLAVFQVCFTAPTFRTFVQVAGGAIARVGPATTTGMLRASGLAARVGHHRFCEFFSRARWDVNQVGVCLARYICERFAGEGAVVVAVDDTFIERFGRKVFGRHLGHDGAAQRKNTVTWGNRLVVVAILIHVPRLRPTPFALPVFIAVHRPARTGQPPELARAVCAAAEAQRSWDLHARKHRVRAQKVRAAARRGHRLPGTAPSTTLLDQARARLEAARAAEQACRQAIRAAITPGTGSTARPTPTEIALVAVTDLADALNRPLHVVADAAYSSPALRALDPRITWTMRIRIDAALHAPAPAPTRGLGRPPRRGPRLPAIPHLADALDFTPQGDRPGYSAAALACQRPHTTHTRPITAVLIRHPGTTTGCDMALASTDTTATAEDLASRYRWRWAIEVCFADAKQHMGLGQARNRTEAAVRRTAAFQLLCTSLVICYYILHGHTAADLAHRRRHTPWYPTKTHTSFTDMLTALRRDILRTRATAILTPPNSAPHQHNNTPPKITAFEQLLTDIGAL